MNARRWMIPGPAMAAAIVTGAGCDSRPTASDRLEANSKAAEARRAVIAADDEVRMKQGIRTAGAVHLSGGTVDAVYIPQRESGMLSKVSERLCVIYHPKQGAPLLHCW